MAADKSNPMENYIARHEQVLRDKRAYLKFTPPPQASPERTFAAQTLAKELVTHEPIAYKDHSDAWIQCTCGWGGFGDSGEDWAAHFLKAITGGIR